MLKQLVMDKTDADALFSKGCGTALVNIIKACNEMGLDDSDFINCFLEGLHLYFDELDTPWVTILLKNMAQLKCEDRRMLLQHIV